MLVLEDIDALFIERESTGASSSISFSGLLNAIDGPASQEGRMLFMTTNHPDRLDPALIRPGRVDMQAELGLAVQMYFVGRFSIYSPATRSVANVFRSAISLAVLPPSAPRR